MKATSESPNPRELTLRVATSPAEVSAQAWDALLAAQDKPTPFMRHAYLAAMHDSGSAVAGTGWQMLWLCLRDGDELVAATTLSLKTHSYGEYVFDWAWARAYEQHGLSYYPKAVTAPPFTPVPGSRLLATDAAARKALLRGAIALCEQQSLSSLHLLFASEADLAACDALGLMRRSTVQFHWENRGYAGYDDYLASLEQSKRKKVRAERRKVAEAGVSWQARRGSEISAQDWAFFYRCYERTYLEHGNAPYLTPAFFEAMKTQMPEAWVMFTALRDAKPIATSLIALDVANTSTYDQNDSKNTQKREKKRAYGRYWGALERVDCLHFDACYHQPIQWCIDNGIAAFEGGAQGEHKLARGLMPTPAYSMHWLADQRFADAVERFLEREGEGIDGYLDELRGHSPFKSAPPA